MAATEVTAKATADTVTIMGMVRNPEATEDMVKTMDTAKVTAVMVKNKEAMIMITDTAKVMEVMVRGTVAMDKITEVMAKVMEDMVKIMAMVTVMVMVKSLAGNGYENQGYQGQSYGPGEN